jgi:hypothetical protein
MPGKLIVDEIEDSGGTSVIGRKNYIINGNFDIWQRGTSVTGGYGPDRFVYQNSGSTGTFAQGSFTAGQTDVPNNPKYFANLTITGADDEANIAHRIEDVNTLSGETATISFYAKHTTNAPTSFNITSWQVFGSGGSTAVNTSIATGQTTTTSWQKYTATVTFPSVSGKTIGAGSYLEVLILNPNNETFDIQIAQVQLEKGSVATDFEVRPIGEELALCQRYYAKSYNQATAPGTASTTTGCLNYITHAGSSNGDRSTIFFPQTMRTTPTVTLYSTATGTSGKIRIENTGTDIDGTAYYIGESTSNYYLNGTQTTGYNAILQYQADAEL